MASCRFTLAASILAAREIGYWTTSDLIFDQGLSPERIYAPFRSSISKTLVAMWLSSSFPAR